jgi:hypothetical protein
LTLADARLFLNRKLSTATLPASERAGTTRPAPAQMVQAQAAAHPVNWVEAAPNRPPPQPRPGLATGPALCEAEERLRRGRVSVRGEQLIRLETEMGAVLYALQQAQEVLAKHIQHDAIPTLPAGAASILRTLSAYARRAESELMHFGINAAE